MANQPIQLQFGETILTAMRAFARQDIGTVVLYEQDHFAHVGEAQLRTTLAETLYGARWLYKLGLALLVQNAEQLAHVRAQVLDYAAICEGLLSDMIRHAIVSGHVHGQKYQFEQTHNLTKPITWGNQVANRIKKRNLFWLIEVAEEEGIVTAAVAQRLHGLRKERNTVHLKSRTYKAYIGTSRAAFDLLNDTIATTKQWRNAHP